MLYTYCHITLETVTPSSFGFPSVGVQTVNGSMEYGGCLEVIINGGGNPQATCSNPTSSVLFDGIAPTLTDLDEDTWAEQLMVLVDPFSQDIPPPLQFDIHFTDIPDYTGVTRAEVALFNCPQWQTGLGTIEVSQQQTSDRIFTSTIRTPVTEVSCDTLITVCIPLEGYTSPLIRLSLERLTGAAFVHLAAIAFYPSGQSPCPITTTTAAIVTTTAAQTPPYQGMYTNHLSRVKACNL